MNEPTPPVTAPVHPGGWVDGIGWVALGSSLGPSDLFARWQGDPPRPKHPYRMCDRTPVIVTCWADGTVPTWVPSHPDSIQFRLRQFTPHHPVASGRQAMMDAADALDVTHCADGSTPQAPTVDSVPVPRDIAFALGLLVGLTDSESHFMAGLTADHVRTLTGLLQRCCGGVQ